MTRTDRQSVLFVCVRNSGESQMAAGLMRAAAPDIEVHSAGTKPGTTLNSLSVQVLAEAGVDISAEVPKPVDPQLLRAVDLVVVLGSEARLDVPEHRSPAVDHRRALRAGHRAYAPGP